MKIGHRLQQLTQMIPEGYDHIWDCCCDHGLLGMWLLACHRAKYIHFVDIVPQLMSALEVKLRQHFPPHPDCVQWQVHYMDVAKLNLKPFHHQTHLIIIAGVGGDRVIELVHAIRNRHPQESIEFLLCPIHHNYKLRKVLRAHDLGLINEKLVCENKRFYELIYVSPNARQPVSLVGCMMWDFSQQADRDYLHRTIAHFERKSQSGNSEDREILAAYQRLQTNNCA